MADSTAHTQAQYYMQWILLGQLRLAGGAEVLPELGPWGQAGTLDDTLELDADVRGGLAVGWCGQERKRSWAMSSPAFWA